jgi:hypothetical protein
MNGLFVDSMEFENETLKKTSPKAKDSLPKSSSTGSNIMACKL